MDATRRKKLLVVGGGSSGLITLKTALETLKGWDIVCFEKSGDIIGCWGCPYPGFISTTTRFATQFAAMPETDAVMKTGDEASFRQFFCEGEYGDYLKRFADRFDLRRSIRLHHEVRSIQRADDGRWCVTYGHPSPSGDVGQAIDTFDALVVCTGLVSRAREVRCDSRSNIRIETDVSQIHQLVNDSVVVVSGGGESAVDTAARLAEPERNNRVYLSLRSGIRVSPRYHPVRGVPSDFLRNRLMLSIHPDLRNTLGDVFVKGRIQFESRFRRWFPTRFGEANPSDKSLRARRRAYRRQQWSMRLHRASREDLFDMFHNKSDQFLLGVETGRIRIIGAPKDERWTTYDRFADPTRMVRLSPDVIVPVIGFQSSLPTLFADPMDLRQFYRGCLHAKHDNLFAVGFARPVIGNIPTISEMQARYVCATLSGTLDRPNGIQEKTRADWREIEKRYTTLADRLGGVYPVEMFPYCDRLAKDLECLPTRNRVGSFRRWCKVQLSPASTLHYWHDGSMRERHERQPIYLPPLLIAILLMIKPIDWVYKLLKS